MIPKAIGVFQKSDLEALGKALDRDLPITFRVNPFSRYNQIMEDALEKFTKEIPERKEKKRRNELS